MANLDPKGERDHSLPEKQRLCSGVETRRCGTRVIWRKLDCLKPSFQETQSIRPPEIMPDNRRRALPWARAWSGAPSGVRSDAQRGHSRKRTGRLSHAITYSEDERGIT